MRKARAIHTPVRVSDRRTSTARCSIPSHGWREKADGRGGAKRGQTQLVQLLSECRTSAMETSNALGERSGGNLCEINSVPGGTELRSRLAIPLTASIACFIDVAPRFAVWAGLAPRIGSGT